MKSLEPLVRNSAWLFLTRVISQGTMVVVTFLLARRLGAAGFGEYAFMASAVMVGNTLTTFGTDIFLIREIAGGGDRRSSAPALVIQMGFSAFLIVVVQAGASLLPNQSPASIAALKLYSFALIPLSFYTIFTSILRGRQRMDLYTWLNLVVALLHVLVIWSFVTAAGGVVRLAGLLVAVQVLAALAGGWMCRAYLPGEWSSAKVTPAGVASLLAGSASIAGIAFLRVLNQRLSLILLALLGGAAVTGWFSAAMRIVEAARIGHHAVLSALFPMMSEASGAGSADVAARYERPFRWLVVAAAAGTLVILIFAPLLIGVIYGGQYRPAQSALRILAFVLVPFTINDYFSISFISEHREQLMIRVMGVYLAALVILMLLLVPAGGQTGASWALLLAECLQALLLFAAWKNKSVLPP